ncbi:lipopolysaccharide biosynthesis regulator YciM [Ruminiclostridium sufflavum DSM 19573]|uniref:Lipopolysaccharide biosynthesis regulator YciM n=1 Tax=Ruminiclostridium sufflavum DSM 19573 TaxID=1121337 RepID=A0A318YBH3_9FIRM|nr:tetratricopeptide repeat protein [Ruminiclostridium sufflavum]PYG89901.1 lipopolysaccharide biosynthesis regulator YciM [Ruminiclostridium sufflavum DSM 19573]
MLLLTAFNMIILVLLIAYVFYRLIKTKTIVTLISFTLQLSALTIVLLSVVNRVQTSTGVELFYISFGIIVPCCIAAYDYYLMIKKVKEKGSYEGLITADKNIKVKSYNTVEIMSVASNDAFVGETLAEISQLSDELFKGIKKKLVQAEEYYRESNYDAACEINNSLIGICGTSSNLYFNYGNICFKKGQLGEALSHYRKVLELNEQLLQKLQKSSHSKTAVNDAISSIRFKEYLVYYNIGVTYLNIGKADFALENFEKSLAINSSFVNAKEGVGRVLVQNGRNAEAVSYYEEILEKDSNNYIIGLLLGKLFVELNDTGRARKCLEQCIRNKPDIPDAYTELGKLYMSEKNYQEAAKLYKKYISIRDDDFTGHYNLAGCCYQTGEFKKAVTEYQKAIMLNSASYNSLFNMALIYEEIKEYDKAIECYENAISIKKDFVDAYNNLGILFSKQQRQFEALAVYSKGIKESPSNFKLYYNMGVVLFELRRYEDAADAFKRAIEINPEDNEVYYYLGAALTELKKYDEAIKAYSRALNENMSDGDLYYNIAAVYALMKKQDIAIDNLKKAINIDPDIKQEIFQNRVFDYILMNSDFMELIS